MESKRKDGLHKLTCPFRASLFVRTGETLDAYVSAVSMQLQLLAQELNGELERGETRGTHGGICRGAWK